MLAGRAPFAFTICIAVLCRTTCSYRLLPFAPYRQAMSKSIKSFFISTTTNVDEGPRKKAKTESISVPVDLSKSQDESSTPATTNDSSDADATSGAALEVSQAPLSTPVDITLGWAPFDAMEPGWKANLAAEYGKPYFKNLLQFLTAESKSQTIYPPAKDIFSAFNLCPLDQVKVVVIGQDPYHGPDQAHGLAFSVRRGVAIPPSLKNMILEAKDDPKVKIPMPTHGNLEHWSRQGVLMLNTVLTVRKGDANSHQKKGWEEFTDAVVRVLSTKKNIVYLLWGNPAQQKCKGIDGKHNTMITTSHPSPLGAYKTNQPFMGSRCFSRCNEALEKYGKEPIDWSIR